MVLVFGLAFEFPLLLMMLNLTGLLTSARMRSWWRQMVLGITVFAAVATPSQDPFTMTALAVPLVGLFFVCIGLAHLVDGRRARRQAVAEAEIAEQLARIDAS
jgi:sec-independent protein translocase protein TatC